MIRWQKENFLPDKRGARAIRVGLAIEDENGAENFANQYSEDEAGQKIRIG